jgi:small-conductance mechanosensitive channel
MSQERTEQRDPIADMQMAQAAETRAAEVRHRMETTERNPIIAETNGAKLIRDKLFGDLEIATALRYYIELSEQRREERDSNQRLHIQSLEEIDRLNAVIESQAEINAQWIDRLKDASAIVADRDKKITDLTAKVQERDHLLQHRDRIIESHTVEQKTVQKLLRQVEERDKEIERMRAALYKAYEEIGHIYGAKPSEVEGMAVAARVKIREVLALKGAE